MPVAILTYHSCNILGNDYADNDHVALAEDPRRLHDMGFEIVPLAEAIERGLAGTQERLAALTFDDGPIFDYEDFEHPTCGFQKSFRRIMAEFAEERGKAVHASAFVIT